MRIIAGIARGTPLAGLKGADVRPTLDRVRESVFNILMPEIEGARFLDLFAGTGAMGLEALSRGASRVVFVEPDPKARRLIETNLAKCKFSETHWALLPLSAERALKQLENEKKSFDFIYVDPPFADDLYAPTLNQLGAGDLLKAEGLIIVEHFHKKELDGKYGKLILSDLRRLGDTSLSFYTV